MKQIIVKLGKTLVENVPTPVLEPKTILVKVHYSCISQGTELSTVTNSGKTKTEKIFTIIKEKPKAIQKAIDIFKNKGISGLYNTVSSVAKIDDSPHPVGYSISGVIKEVGSEIEEFQIGDRVACAGAGIANHAEYVVVPKNLAIKVPRNLDLKNASTVTLGGIAMQGIRRGDFKIGEIVTVIGLGLLGQLTVQILSASGCRVIAIDIDEHRCKVAEKYGAEKVYNSAEYKKIENEIIRYSDGYGVDGVIFTAATENPEIISNAFKMCKKKGRVILVGIAGDKIKRNDLYKKELDYLISTSYGPGRYDDNYEIKGIDYPYAYVRWTENRNMAEYLRLLSNGKVKIGDLIERIYPISEGDKAYEELKNIPDKPIAALFEYPENNDVKHTKIELRPLLKLDKKVVNVAIIGAGGFAKSVHLPNLSKLNNLYNIYAICDINSLNAKETAGKFGASVATTDYNEILKDSNVDMVMICTRHNLHADYSIKALKAGKAVFCEKPMAIGQNELDKLIETIKDTNLPYMVGFNRRFSPHAKKIKDNISSRTNPILISYRMNAGYIPSDSWVHEDGGRIVGEGCHIIDLFKYFIESEIISMSADKINPKTKAFSSTDNITLNLKYKDGSIANLIYTSLGNTKYPKEHLEIYCDNTIYKMEDYLSLKIYNEKYREESLKHQDKGHLRELVEFHESLINRDMLLPISIDDMIETTKLTFLI